MEATVTGFHFATAVLCLHFYLCCGAHFLPRMGDSPTAMAEWCGFQQAMSTPELQSLRAHIIEQNPFLITDGDNFAAVYGVAEHFGRISSRGVICDVENFAPELQHMNALARSVEEDKKVFFPKVGSAQEGMRSVSAFRLTVDDAEWINLIPGDMKKMTEDQARMSPKEYHRHSQVQPTTITAAHWFFTSSVLGVLTQIHLPSYSRSLTAALAVGILLAAELTSTPIVSPAVNWTYVHGSELVNTSTSWFWGNIMKQVLLLLCTMMLFWLLWKCACRNVRSKGPKKTQSVSSRKSSRSHSRSSVASETPEEHQDNGLTEERDTKKTIASVDLKKKAHTNKSNVNVGGVSRASDNNAVETDIKDSPPETNELQNGHFYYVHGRWCLVR